MDKDELKKKLTPEEYHVTQEKGTEAPFSGKFLNHNEKGSYVCKICGQVLFPSDTKLDSSKLDWGLQGWPAFDQAVPGSIEYREDTSYGLVRTEVVCSNCKAHLGHIFEDDTSTAKHICANSCSLDFKSE